MKKIIKLFVKLYVLKTIKDILNMFEQHIK